MEDLGLIPELGRSPGEGKGYPLQYSSLENFMDCIVHGVKELDMPDFHFVHLSYRGVQSQSESRSVSICSRPYGLYSPWNSPDQNTGVGSHSLLQGTFLTHRSNLGLHIVGGFFTS